MIVNVLRIETILAEQNMTKVEFARKCGVSRQTISTILRSGSCEPRTAGKLALGLGVSVSDILEGNRC